MLKENEHWYWASMGYLEAHIKHQKEIFLRDEKIASIERDMEEWKRLTTVYRDALKKMDTCDNPVCFEDLHSAYCDCGGDYITRILDSIPLPGTPEVNLD
jgi:hypothetical protein